MQSSKPRIGSSEMAQKTSPSSSRSTKGSPSSPDSSNSKHSRPLDRKPSPKPAPSPEKRAVRTTEMQQQLGEELKRAREEKSRVLEELREVKKAMAERGGMDNSSESAEKIKMLEREVENAKDSERKMLESLVSQTKQLEETKIALEEAKLEIRTLREGIRGLNGSAGRSGRNLEKQLEKPKLSDSVHQQEEVARLRNELKLAVGAEENSKKAMDGLALALKEVTMEMNQVKEKLSATQSQLERVSAEADHSKATLKSTEEKFQLVSVEVERLKSEADESIAVWNEKENGFINCMKISEEDITRAENENSRLIDTQRAAREENSKMRDIMKHAVNEATVVKEALEIARNENSHLKDLLCDKDNAWKTIVQEYECIKVSEAAALDSVRELKNLLAATSASDSSNNARTTTSLITKPGAVDEDVRESKSTVTKFSSERWKGDDARIQNGSVKGPAVRSGSFHGPVFDRVRSPEQQRKDRRFASLSSVFDLNAPSSLALGDRATVMSDDFDHIERTYLHGNVSPTKQKKKPIFRRVGDMLRRSFHNKGESPVIT